jgi:hypothetical protein
MMAGKCPVSYFESLGYSREEAMQMYYEQGTDGDAYLRARSWNRILKQHNEEMAAHDAPYTGMFQDSAQRYTPGSCETPQPNAAPKQLPEGNYPVEMPQGIKRQVKIKGEWVDV